METIPKLKLLVGIEIFNCVSSCCSHSTFLCSGGDITHFYRREWSFTIADDIYIRYQCFKNFEEFKAGIQKRQPHKIDIGAVFTHPPKEHNSLTPDVFKTVERELVFDIDMTDYDDIRTCCDGANICHKCWPFMTMALKVIDRAVREDFGFKNLVWIYSGRRGIHCWVCDPAARALKNDERDAIINYLSVETGTNENSSKAMKRQFVTPLHPMIMRAYKMLEPYFEKYICSERGQGLLISKKKFVPLLNSLPNEDIRATLYKLWDKDDEIIPTLTGIDRWNQLRSATGSSVGSSTLINEKKRARVNYVDLEAWRVELVLKYCYPRLDANVSKQQNHLLKSPFCVHPKTGRVCLPIDPIYADDFDPFTVPTLRQLCAQIDTYNGPADVDDIEKTDMKKALETFDQAFMHDMKSTNRRELRERMDIQDANPMEIDF